MPPTAEQLLRSIEQDSQALSVAASNGLDAPVPSCPGWTLRDLVTHTGKVHRQKEEVLRSRLTDDKSDVKSPVGDLLDWFNEGAASLLSTLRSVEPSTPMWTWHTPDQTAGFWYRRMAHETLIHRVDAELAHGTVTTIDAEIAEDGIDEALVAFIAGIPPWAEADPGDVVIRLTTPNRHWSLREATFSGTTKSGRVLSKIPTVLLEPGATKRDCEISGGSAALNLWLWGRGSLSDLIVSGDPAHAEMLRTVASDST